MKIKVKDHENLVRDKETSAILNVDLDSLNSYKKRRNSLKKKDQELESIKQEVSELKELVTKLLTEKK